MAKKRILVFASGTKNGGGSGLANLHEQARITPGLNYEVVGVASNFEHGGVRRHAEARQVTFRHFSSGVWSGEEYQRLVQEFQPDLVALSGWLKPVRGLSAGRVINIHPGPLTRKEMGKPLYGGKDMHGDAIHAAVLKNKEKFTAVTMHFVPSFDGRGYDCGPVFFEKRIPILPDDTIDTLRKRVNAVEHEWQPYLTSLVAHNHIWYDEDLAGKVGSNPACFPFFPRQ